MKNVGGNGTALWIKINCNSSLYGLALDCLRARRLAKLTGLGAGRLMGWQACGLVACGL